MSFKYHAFLSYSHADTATAKWLHKRLESYPLRGLSGRDTELGRVPKELRPIFRDREDFSAGHSLTAQTLDALDSSASLVVLCSPASAKSAYVNEEVRLFKAAYPERPVVPLILDGSPGGGEHECFPPALRFEFDRDGSVSDRPAHILAADLRESGDGRELALAKVVAALIGVPSDEVFRRAERERRRQARIRYAIAAAIMLLAGGGGYFGWQSRTQQQTLTEIEAIVNELAPVGSAQAREGSRESLTAAIKSIARGGAADPRQAQAFALLKAGKPQQAEALLRAVAEDKKARIDADRKQTAEAYRNLGAIAGLGDPKRAREYYAEAVSLDPEDRESLYWLGWLNFLAGHLAEADQALSALLRQAVAANDERALYRAEMRLGEVDSQRGSLSAAMERQRRALAIADRRAKTAPDDLEAQRDLSVSYNKVGDVLKDQGILPDALKSYQDSLAIADRLAKADPGNAGWQFDLGISRERIGDVLMAQGDLAAALKSYEAKREIISRLAKADPGNSGWQRDLSVSYEKVGDVLVAQGNLPEALKSYQAGLAIADRLAKADPGNAGWQRDLSVSYDRVGDVLVAQGNVPEALKSYQAGLAIRDRLAKTDPNNAGWQRDVAVSHAKLADLYRRQGEKAAALDALGKGRDIMSRMTALSPDNAGWKRDLAWFEAQIAALEK